LIGAVVCLLAACRRSNCTLTRAMNGRICAAAPLALAKQLPLPTIVQRGIAAVSSDRSTRPLPLPLFYTGCVALLCVALRHVASFFRIPQDAATQRNVYLRMRTAKK